MTTKCALYARTSGDDRERDSLGSQIDLCRKYAQERGYTVIAELAEDERGISGAVMYPPRLEEALELARSGRIEVLVVREVDRLARNLTKQLVCRQEMEEAGARIEYVLQQFGADDDGRFVENLHAVIAERERVLITRRLVRGRRDRAKRGEPMTHGKAPYGYQLAYLSRQGETATAEERERGQFRRELVIDKEQARVIELIFDWYTREGLSILKISERLSAMGIPTKADLAENQDGEGYAKQRARGQWNRTSVGRILKSETYAGVFHYGKASYTKTGKKIENPPETWLAVDVPAIISRETWEAAQERLATNPARGHRQAKHEYLVARRVTCLHCGTSISCRTTKGRDTLYSYYLCPVAAGRPDYAKECDQVKYFPAGPVDAAVWDWVVTLLTDPAAALAGMQEEQAARDNAAEPLRDRLAVIDNLVIRAEADLSGALNLAIRGGRAAELLKEKITELEAKIDGLSQERDGLAEEIQERTISDSEIVAVGEWARGVAAGLDLAAMDFTKRRKIIEELDLTVRLGIEDGEPVGRVRCKAARTGDLSFGDTSKWTGFRRRRNGLSANTGCLRARSGC